MITSTKRQGTSNSVINVRGHLGVNTIVHVSSQIGC